MKKLHILVIKSYLGPLLFTFLIAMFVLLMQFLWKYIDDLIGKGLDGSIISELLFYTSASLVTMALPLAILFASIMSFGNMGENYELLACKASGISLQKVMLPLVIFAIIMTISAHLFANYILPVTNLKSKTLLYDIRKQKPEVQIPAGIFYNGIEGYTIRVDEKSKENNILKGIKIYDHSNKVGNNNVTVADSGHLKMTSDEKYLELILYNGYSYNEEKESNIKHKHQKTYPFRRDIFKKQTVRIEINQGLSRSDDNLFKKRDQMLNIKQLEAYIDTMNKDIDTIKIAFNRSMFRNVYFRMENQKANRNQKYYPNLISSNLVNTDSIFKTINFKKQKNVIKEALNFVRADKNRVLNSQVRYSSKIHTIRRYQVSLHMKYVFPFACFIFFFIGAPMGAIIRKGGLGLPSVISILLFIFYYIISLTGEKMVKENIVPAYIGMWISSVILLATGIFLTYKATTESVILNPNMYINMLKKYFGFKKKKSISKNGK